MMKTLARMISVDMRKQAVIDVVNHELDDMLTAFPDAQVICIELRSFKE